MRRILHIDMDAFFAAVENDHITAGRRKTIDKPSMISMMSQLLAKCQSVDII
jgi:nucleotidyltransferase/DNA polymerase involved in DNA repair